MSSNNSAYAAAVLRLALGVMFTAHALLKIFVFTPAGSASFFESLGLPSSLAYIVITAELIGGAVLIIGWQSRKAVLVLLPILLGSFIVHGGNGWVFSNSGGGWEYPAFLVATSIAQFFLGDGAYSLSSYLSHDNHRHVNS